MPICRWKGDAPAVAQVVRLTVGSSAAGQTFITTMNGKSLTYVATPTDTAATIAAAIQVLLSGSEIPEFREVTWSLDGSSVVGTAARPGVPFTVTVSGTGTYTLTTVQDSTGPNHADEPRNWSTGALPAAGDDVLIDEGEDILYGLGALAPAVNLNSLVIKASFSGRIGLPLIHQSGYWEYRPRHFPVAAGVPVEVGQGDGPGPEFVNLALTGPANVVVHATSQGSDSRTPCVNLQGSTGGTLTVASGSVGLAVEDSIGSCTLGTVNINDGAIVVSGPNSVVSQLLQNGGRAVCYGVVTSLLHRAGETELHRPPQTIEGHRGQIACRFTGTVQTVELSGDGSTDSVRLDFSSDPRSRTVVNHTVTGGASLHDPDRTITFTNPGTWDSSSVQASHFGTRFQLHRL